MKDFVYFDNAATTFCSEKVGKALAKFYSVPHGNPSSIHRLGFESAKIIKRARDFFADAFKVGPKQVIFTGSGTEANNLAISGSLKKSKKKCPVVLASPIEHSSVSRNVEYWESSDCGLQRLKVDQNGVVDLDDLKRRLEDSKVSLVTVMAVNNEIGTIEPIQKIGEVIRQSNPDVYFHVDAIQAFGKTPVKFSEWRADLMTLSSHKIHGPVGAGALIMSERVDLSPLVYGGGQEFGLRSGTESVGMIHGCF